MNKDAPGLRGFGNKYKPAFEARHNPAQRLFVDRQSLMTDLVAKPLSQDLFSRGSRPS
jgi:hypothetical protein